MIDCPAITVEFSGVETYMWPLPCFAPIYIKACIDIFFHSLKGIFRSHTACRYDIKPVSFIKHDVSYLK